VNSVDRVENRSVLHYLCLYGHECEDFCNVIRFLVECGLNVQAKTKKGDSALTLLCQHYSGDQLLEATRFLIDHSSGDVNHKNDEGKNALHCLCENEDLETADGLIDLVRLLIESGLDPTATTKTGDSALALLFQHKATGLLEIVRLFVTEFGLN